MLFFTNVSFCKPVFWNITSLLRREATKKREITFTKVNKRVQDPHNAPVNILLDNRWRCAIIARISIIITLAWSRYSFVYRLWNFSSFCSTAGVCCAPEHHRSVFHSYPPHNVHLTTLVLGQHTTGSQCIQRTLSLPQTWTLESTPCGTRPCSGPGRTGGRPRLSTSETESQQ